MRSRPSPPSETAILRRSMATSLCSTLVLVTLLQAPPPTPPTPPPSPGGALAPPRRRATPDSTDPQLWLAVGRPYLGLGAEAHGATHPAREDTVWTRAAPH